MDREEEVFSMWPKRRRNTLITILILLLGFMLIKMYQRDTSMWHDQVKLHGRQFSGASLQHTQCIFLRYVALCHS